MSIHYYPWNILEVEEMPQDERAVKRAYSQKLKKIDRSDVDVFQGLQQAYKLALELVKEDDEENVSLRDAVAFQDFASEELEGENPSLSALQREEEFSAKSESLKERITSQEFDIYEDGELDEQDIDGNETSWPQEQEQKQAQIAILYEQLSEPKNFRYSKWKELLSSPLMEDIEARQLIKEHIIDILAEYIEVNEQEQVYFRYHMEPQLIAYLHEKFDFSVASAGKNSDEEKMVFMALHQYNYLKLKEGSSKPFFPSKTKDKIAEILAYFLSISFLAALAVIGGGFNVAFAAVFLLAAIFALAIYVRPLFSQKENYKKAIFIFGGLGILILKLSFILGSSRGGYIFFSLYCNFILIAFLYNRQESLYPQRSFIANAVWSLFHAFHIALIIRGGWAIIYSNITGAALPNLWLCFYILIAAGAYGFWFLSRGD